MLLGISIGLLIICYFASALSNNFFIRWSSLMIIISYLIIGWISYHHKSSEPVIIQKSSDSDWELYSGDLTIKSDTCITTIKIINQTDTVYPITCYKVLKHESN